VPAPISEDLRERVVRLYRQGAATYDDVAELLDIGRASVSRFLRMHREQGSVAPKPATGGPRERLDQAAIKQLVTLVESHPDLTLEALTARWSEQHADKAVSASTIGRALKRAGITLKKRRFAQRKSTART